MLRGHGKVTNAVSFASSVCPSLLLLNCMARRTAIELLAAVARKMFKTMTTNALLIVTRSRIFGLFMATQEISSMG